MRRTTTAHTATLSNFTTRREHCYVQLQPVRIVRMVPGNRQRAVFLALCCDVRVPRSAIGYVVQLVTVSASAAVRADACRQLSRFVPII